MTTPPTEREPKLPDGEPAVHEAVLPRDFVRKVVVATLAGALLFAALAFYADLRELRVAAATFSPAAAGLGFAAAAGNYALRAVRWDFYLRRVDARVPFVESAVVFLCGFAMSVTPGKVGEVWKSVLLRESRDIPMASTAPIVIAERLTDLVAVALLAAIGSVAFKRGLLLAIAGAAIAAGVVAVCSYRPLGEALLRFSERVPIVSKLSPRLRVSYGALLTLLRPLVLLVGTAVAFVAWGLQCGTLYVVARGFPGVELGFPAAMFAFAASTIAGAAAMVPGGLGVTEVGMTGLLCALGGPAMTRPVALAATMVTRVATLWFALLIGLVAIVVYRAMDGRRRALRV